MRLWGRFSDTGAGRHVDQPRATRFRSSSVIVAALFVLSVVPVAVPSNAGAASQTGAPTSSNNSGEYAGRPTRVSVPGAPTHVKALAGNASVVLSWNAPSSNGGSAITGYVVTPSIGWAFNVSNVTSETIGPLTNGLSYTFSVAAVNVAGIGASTSSNAVTPVATPPPTKSSLVVPLYDPNSADWASTCSALSSSNSFVVADVGDPSGPGTSASSSWASNFMDCGSAHVGVLGYVDSDYCQAPIATVESQVDSWYAWYASVGVDGIFVDEAASPYSPTSQSDCLSGTMSAVAYYQAVSAYIHAEGVNQTVTLNFGANPISSWPLSSTVAAQNADILVIFESPYSEYVNYANSGRPWTAAAWESAFSPKHFSVLVYDAVDANLPGAFCSVVTQQNVGYAYATPNAGWTTPAPSAYLQGELNGC